MEVNKKKYEQYVKEITPTHSMFRNVAAAFLVGGIICVLGQISINFMTNRMGMDQEAAGAWMLMELIFLSIILTGFNIFPKIVQFAGAGALVPITGFANSVAAPAIEFHSEGEVFGVGCKIFTIAGPVILYGLLSSWLLGIGYMILRWIGVL